MGEKKYTLRELQADDFFIITTILGKIGVGEFKNLFTPELINVAAAAVLDGDQSLQETVGYNVFFDAAGIILNNMEPCKHDVYRFVSDLTGIPAEKVGKLPITTFFEIIMNIVKKEEFRDFFGAALRLLA